MAFDGTYPAPPGNKHFSIVEVPINAASYTQIVTGSPVTGGIAVAASTFGLKYIEAAYPMGSDNGQYDSAVFITPFQLNKPGTGFRLQIIVSTTGVEVAAAGVIAAGRTMRVLVIGY